MSLFEYVAIAFSLVFSFSVIRLVAGLPYASAEGRYWIHLGFCFLQLIVTAVAFWAFWLYRDVDWTLPRFLLVLANPALVYFNICALVPDDPKAVGSWRAHYYATRRRYFLGLGAWALVIALAGTLVLGIPVLHPLRAMQAGILVIGVVGAASTDPRVHGSIMLLAFLLLLAVVSTVFSSPTLLPA